MKVAKRELCHDRKHFADRLYADGKTFAVADGMGRGKGAIVAAEKAIEILRESSPFASLEDIEEFYRRANKEVMKATAKLGDVQVSGTTLSLLSLDDEWFRIGHVGDSRIYLIRDGEILLLTEDQVAYQGTRKQVNVLGMDWNPPVILRKGRLKEGDVFLLISDGVIGKLSDRELLDSMDSDVERSAENILEAYRGTGSGEDLSYIIVAT